MLYILLAALAPIVGGLIAAVALGYLLWNLLKMLRHPEYGPMIGLIGILALILVGVRVHQLLAMTAFFLFIAAVVAWPEGAEWRKRHPGN